LAGDAKKCHVRWQPAGKEKDFNSVLLFELHYISLHLQFATELLFVFTVYVFFGSLESHPV